MVPAGAASADCMKQFPKWHNEQKAEYEACDQRAMDARIGKYFCYIKHSVGIQYPLREGKLDTTQQPFAGRIRRASDKFIAVLSKKDNFCEDPAQRSKEDCVEFFWKHRGSDYPIKYELEITGDESFFGISDDAHNFRSPLVGTFYLYGNNEFVSFQSGGNNYLTTGKCEKIT